MVAAAEGRGAYSEEESLLARMEALTATPPACAAQWASMYRCAPSDCPSASQRACARPLIPAPCTIMVWDSQPVFALTAAT